MAFEAMTVRCAACSVYLLVIVPFVLSLSTPTKGKAGQLSDSIFIFGTIAITTRIVRASLRYGRAE
jgi:hypothetical protein